MEASLMALLSKSKMNNSYKIKKNQLKKKYIRRDGNWNLSKKKKSNYILIRMLKRSLNLCEYFILVN